MADKKNRSGLGGRGLDAIFGTNVEQFLDEIQNSRSEGTGSACPRHTGGWTPISARCRSSSGTSAWPSWACGAGAPYAWTTTA